MKRALPIFLCLALVLLSGCGEAGSGGADLPSPQAAVIQADLSGLDLEFTAQDLDVGYEETTVIQVALQGETIQVDGTGTPAKRYQSILLSSPDLERGETYTFTAGDQSVEVTLTKRASSVGETGGLRRK